MPRLLFHDKAIPILAAAAFAVAAAAMPAHSQGEIDCPPGYVYDSAYGCRADYSYGSPYWFSPGLGLYFGGRDWGGRREWRDRPPAGGFGGGNPPVGLGGGGIGGGKHGGGHHKPKP